MTTNAQNTTATPVAKLKDFALRVSLTVTKPQLTAKDDKATDDAERANNAHGAGQYRKDLYPKHLIAPIQEVESAARGFIAKRTLDGVLPSASFIQFADAIAPYETAFNQAVTVFLNNYTQTLHHARQSQGSLFDASLYPDTTTLRNRFTWNVTYEPIHDHSQFAAILAPMENAARQALTAHITKQVQAQSSSIVSEAVARLQKVVAHMAVTLAKPDRTSINKKTGGIEVKPPIFRDSVIENIEEITTFLDAYADALPQPVLDLMSKADMLTAHKISDLRDDPEQRKAAQKQASALLDEINEALGISTTPANSTELAPAAPAPAEPLPPPPEVAIVEPDADVVAEALKQVPKTITPPPAATTDLFAALADYDEEF